MELFKDYDSLIDNTNEISNVMSLETKGYFCLNILFQKT